MLIVTSDSNGQHDSIRLTPPQDEFPGSSEATISAIGFNSVSHDGLKSFSSAASTESAHDLSFPEVSSAATAMSSVPENATIIPQKIPQSLATAITPAKENEPIPCDFAVAIPSTPNDVSPLGDVDGIKLERLYVQPRSPSGGSTWVPPTVPEGWVAEWSDHFQKWFETSLRLVGGARLTYK
jgi:hypothetical protein